MEGRDVGWHTRGPPLGTGRASGLVAQNIMAPSARSRHCGKRSTASFEGHDI